MKNISYPQILMRLLRYADHRKMAIISTLVFFQALLEFVGVGAFFPYIKILQNPGNIFNSHYLNGVYHALSFSSVNAFYIFGGCIIFTTILLRGAIILYNYHLQARFCCDLRLKFSNDAITSYLDKNYEVLSELHSGEISKNILLEISNTVSCVKQLLQMVTYTVSSAFLIIFLIFLQPYIIFSVGLTLSTVLFLTFYFAKPRLNKCSDGTQQANRDVYALISDIFKSCKDIKVLDASQYFIAKFSKKIVALNKNLIIYNYLSNFPGVILNVIAFGALIFVLLSLLSTHGNLVAALPAIAVIGVAAQRLLPMMTQIYNALGFVKRYEAGTKIIYDLIFSKDNKPTEMMVAQPLIFRHKIKIDHLSYRYKGSMEDVFLPLSCSIQKNKILGIVGRSGAGKTTLIDILLGLLDGYKGAIYVDDMEITKSNIGALRKIVGYVPQFTSFVDGTLKENIAFGIEPDEISNHLVKQSCSLAQLDDFVASLSRGLDTPIGEAGERLSGGQRQRLGIARALYRQPQILILDEPTSSLDKDTQLKLLTSIKELAKNVTIVLITHKVEPMSICDHILDMNEYLIKNADLHSKLAVCE